MGLDAFVTINGRQYAGTEPMMAERRWRWPIGIYTYINYDGPPVPSADIIFRPNTAAARETADVFAIWGGELIYKDVPAEIEDDKPTTRPATATAPL